MFFASSTQTGNTKSDKGKDAGHSFTEKTKHSKSLQSQMQKDERKMFKEQQKLMVR